MKKILYFILLLVVAVSCSPDEYSTPENLMAEQIDWGYTATDVTNEYTLYNNTPGVSSIWDFGNGVTQKGSSVTAQYTFAGTYTVKLTVVSQGGVTIVEDEIDALLPEMEKRFAGVLIDAPCSGLGVIRRHPDIRWSRKPADLLRYQDRQISLLASGAKLVTPGGLLVYVSCSIEPEENDQTVDMFLAMHPGYQLVHCQDTLPAKGSSLVDQRGFFRTRPGQHDMDGFFAAKFQRLK